MRSNHVAIVSAAALLAAISCGAPADVRSRSEVSVAPEVASTLGTAESAETAVTETALAETGVAETAVTETAVAEERADRVGVAETSFDAELSAAPLDRLGTPVCARGVEPADLTAFFDGADPLLGVDYQHAIPLPNGRVLWLFHDVFLPSPSGIVHIHNAGLLQSGRCFQLLRGGTDAAPLPYLFGDLTEPFHRWFWPLDAGLGTDGLLRVFVAEVHELTPTYLTVVEPVATWIVTIDPTDLRVVDRRRAPDDSDALYGWAVVSAGSWTYLYAHCFRQFGWDPLWFAPQVLAHDLSCGPNVTVARIPRGEFDTEPSYWDGSSWVDDPAAAVPVIPTRDRGVNPTQVELWNGRFVAITKVDDWWGRTVELDVAEAAAGPWTTYASVPIEPECDRCNTYFASFMPFGTRADSFLVGLSVNVWSGDDLGHYSPTFLRVPTPP